MVKKIVEKIITNGELLNNLQQELGFSTAISAVPQKTEKLVKVVYPIIPKVNIVKSASGSAPIYTVPVGYVFYLTHAWITPSTSGGFITIERDGTTINILGSTYLAGTNEATAVGQSISLYYPIVVRSGEIITLSAGDGGVGGFLIKGVG